MNQYITEEDTPDELEELRVFLIKYPIKDKKNPKVKAKRQYALYECLNPKYFEHGIRLEDAFTKLDTMNPRHNQNLIRIF